MRGSTSPTSPNVLIIVTDQERYPPPYETEAVARYRTTHMPARELLRLRGVEMHRHYTGSTACVPSRATLFTGQYPSLHGVANTDGLAKSAADPAVNWLDPDSVPTMGDWFRAAGYRTHYRGKWHISHADLLVPGTHQALLANDDDGNPVPEVVEMYRNADRLDPFGFSGWIGREPHGPSKANCGYVRDGLFADQVCDLIGDMAASRDEGPWLAIASFVNPHDIVFSGVGAQFLGFPELGDDVPEVPEPPSQSDGFDGRPGCHAGIIGAWHGMVYPQPVDDTYRRFYYWLHTVVDAAIMRLLEALDEAGMTDDTIVVFTADHGELLGAHGGMQQKWHNAFDEALRVPLVVSGPGVDTAPGGYGLPTSHTDLLPTLLGLAGVDVEAAADTVGIRHFETHPLVGRDLSPLLTGGAAEADHAAPVYFMTEDQISVGLRTTNQFTQLPFDPVADPSRVEAVVTSLPTGDGGTPELWKLARTYTHVDDPEAGEEWELYHLAADPEERTNLTGTAPVAATEAALRDVLVAERTRARVAPRHQG